MPPPPPPPNDVCLCIYMHGMMEIARVTVMHIMVIKFILILSYRTLVAYIKSLSSIQRDCGLPSLKVEEICRCLMIRL